jgi:acetyl esterase/lipase
MMDIITRYYDKKIVLKRSVDICCPETLKSNTALFYIHGGGWGRGAKENFHYHLEHFTNKGYFCSSIGYRLVPSVRFTQQIADIIQGYDCCLSFIKENNLNINKIIIVGSSAGAHLASLIALTSHDFFTKNIKLNNSWIKPAACISINGPGSLEEWPDMNGHIKSCVEELVNTKYSEDNRIFSYISPITYVDSKTPPFLFILAGEEEFFPHRFIYDMHKKIKQYEKYSRVEVFDGEKHGFFYELDGKVKERALRVMEEFIKNVDNAGGI